MFSDCDSLASPSASAAGSDEVASRRLIDFSLSREIFGPREGL